MEAPRLCPYCLQPLPGAAQSCPHCGKSFAGRNPGGTLPVGTVLAGRYTVGEMLSIDGEGILYRGAENLGRFRVTIKEYLPITLTAERTAESTLRPKTGSEVLFKTTRMDFADLYRALERITPATGLEAVLDVVEANNTVYAVMENLGGTPLDQWLAAQGAIMAIGLFIGLVCSVIGLFFGHIILFDSIALGIAAGVCCNQFTAIHPALCLVIGIATFLLLLWLQNTSIGFWLVGGLLTLIYAAVFGLLANFISEHDSMWGWVIFVLVFLVVGALHLRARDN